MRGFEVVAVGLLGALAVELVAVALVVVSALVYECRRAVLARKPRKGVQMSEPEAFGPLPRPWERPYEQTAIPELRLILPGWMGEAVVLRRLVAAAERLHRTLGRLASANAVEAAGLRESGSDPVRLAYLRGESRGLQIAAENLGEEIVQELDLWLSVEVQRPPTAEQVRDLGARLGWLRVVPAVPEPVRLPEAEALVRELAGLRTQVVEQAGHMNWLAWQSWEDDASWRYEQHLASALTFAQMADCLDSLLARACGGEDAYRAWLAEHGSWQSHIIGPAQRPPTAVFDGA